MNKIIIIIFIVLLGIAGLVFINNQNKLSVNNQPIIPFNQTNKDTEIIADNLNIPWEIAFLPDNQILVTQRPGTIILIKDKQQIPIEGVEHIGEGGLLGLAIHPEFEKNKFIYIYFTSRTAEGLTDRRGLFSIENRRGLFSIENRVERYKFEGNNLFDKKVILEGIAGASNHDGGRIAFGPDKLLYITTGDAQNSDSAQDRNSLNGKILRVKDDGSIPEDNPFGNAVYSYGHRNSQGLAWDDQGRLWATEHGRSGVSSGLDELNIIEIGKNYGWPVIAGDEKREGMESPIINSGPSITWAPTGAVFYQGNIFFTGLRGEALYKYSIADKSIKEYFKGEFGRLRTVTIGPDNNFYILTNNTDGRGTPKEGDDKLIKVNPRSLN